MAMKVAPIIDFQHQSMPDLDFHGTFFGVGYSHLKVVSRQRGDSVNGQYDNDALYGFCSF